MIELRIPSKVILFGEWAILKSFPGLGLALNKDFRLRAIRSLDSHWELHSEGYVETLIPWKHGPDDSFFRFFLAGLRSQLHESTKGFVVDLWKNWKTEDGLGSSSASLLAGALLGRYLRSPGDPTDPADFWAELLPVLRSAQKGRGSGFDLAIQIFGGALRFEKGRPQEKVSLRIPPELALVHTGEKWDSTQKMASFDPPDDFLRGMGRVTEDFFKFEDWTRAIADSHRLLEKVGLIQEDFSRPLIDLFREGKVECWKSTGAGGGDSLLCWSSDPEALKAACEKKAYGCTHPLVLALPPEIDSRK